MGANTFAWANGALFLATSHDLLKSIDTGRTWKSIAEPLPIRHVSTVEARNDTVLAMGPNGRVYRTVNHGFNWDPAPPTTAEGLPMAARRNSDATVWRVDHTDSTITIDHVTGFAAEIHGVDGTLISDIVAGSDRFYVARRRDTIESVRLPSMVSTKVDPGPIANEYITSLLIHGSRLYAGVRGGVGNVYVMQDGESGWTLIQNTGEIMGVDVVRLSLGDRGVYVATREHGVLFIEHGTNILRSISNGLRRSVIQSLTLLGSSFIIGSRTEGVLCMDSTGAAIRSLTRSLPPSSEYVVTTIDSTILVSLSSGVLARSTDAGSSWEFLDTLFPNSTLNHLQTNNGSVYASTLSGVRVSHDRGTTWTGLHPIVDGTNVTKVFVNDSITILVSSRTTTLLYPDGRTAAFSPATKTPSPPKIYQVVFRDKKIYAAGYPGFFMSEDNGRTWRSQSFDKSAAIRTLTIVGKRLLVVTDAGVLLATELP